MCVFKCFFIPPLFTHQCSIGSTYACQTVFPLSVMVIGS